MLLFLARGLRRFLRLLPSKLRERDKIQHMVWSFWLMLGFVMLWSAPQAFVAVLALGLAKECWDHRYGSGFCLFDMAGNVVGSVAGLLFVVGMVASFMGWCKDVAIS